VGILEAIETSGFSMLVKQSGTAYVAVLAFHTIGLIFLAGVSGATAMRVLGVARSIPLAPIKEFYQLMYAGLWINVLTGSVLICLYPTEYVVDPSFYIKIGGVVAALTLVQKLKNHLYGGGEGMDTPAGVKKAKTLAASLLVAWLVATVTGRVIAYSVTTKVQTAIGVVIVVILGLLVIRFAGRSLGLVKS